MKDQNKNVEPSGDELLNILFEVLRKAAMMIIVGMIQSMAYRLETQRLQEVLGREPDILDRIKYRACREVASESKREQAAEREWKKLLAAAWEDTDKL